MMNGTLLEQDRPNAVFYLPKSPAAAKKQPTFLKGIMKKVEIGLKTNDEYFVKREDTAKSFDSGALNVLATPVLICSAEKSCKNLVDPLMEDGWGTVGTLINIRHLAPTPVGMKYTCECEVTAVEGRMIRFHVVLYDEIEKIGEGIHERFIINNERFTAKANGKLSENGKKQSPE